MPTIRVELRNFTPPLRSPQNVAVSVADLVRAAITVGKPPLAVSMGGPALLTPPPRRAFVDLTWRAHLVHTHLRDQGGRWVRSAAYHALDPSEKSAVSYFLGNTQAKLMSELLLGVPHLVHLDTLLAALGVPTRKSRPDFLGCDLTGAVMPIALEAKGRTRAVTDELITRAKAQARRVPAITGLPTPTPVSSIAWFDGDEWMSRLEDPPAIRGDDRPVEQVVVASYLPIALALALPQTERGHDMHSVALPDADLTLNLPAPIAQAMAPVVSGAPLQEVAGAAFAQIKQYLTESEAAASQPEGAMSDRVSVGLDRVTVTLGDAWTAFTGTSGSNASSRQELQA